MRIFKAVFLLVNHKNHMAIVLLLSVFSTTLVAQSKEKIQKTAVETVTFDNLVSIDTQIEFLSWFMGSNRPQFSTDLKEDNLSNPKGITRKQIMSLGITPNKVLYRTFMKKVSSKDADIV